MFYKFSKSIFDDLIKSGFHILTGEAVKQIYNDNTEIVALEKQHGSMLYIVFMHNTLQHETEKLISELVKINDYLWHVPYIKNFKQVVVLNILPTTKETPNIQLDNILKAPANIPDAFIYNVFWEADLTNKKINTGTNQPSKVLGIEKIVKNSMDNLNSGVVIIPTNKSIAEVYKDTVITTIKTTQLNLRPPYATFGLILIMFFMLIYTNYVAPFSIVKLNVNADAVFNRGQIYRIFSAIFVHAGIYHFLNNALGIYIFGARIERVYGKFNMLMTFMLSAIMGNIFSILLMPNSYSVGASGGVFGLLGLALGVTLVNRNLLFGLDFNTIAIMTVVMVCSSFVVPDVNFVAHIVGLLVGLLSSVYFVFDDIKKLVKQRG